MGLLVTKMQSSAEKNWGAAQEHLRSMLNADTYNLWFAPLRASALPQDSNSIVLEVANDFCGVWLKDNYMELLQDVLALASGRQLQVKFKVGSGPSPTAPASAVVPAKAKTTDAASEKYGPHDLSFHPKNNFETFVVRNNNNFAYAAALAVAQAAGKFYKP